MLKEMFNKYIYLEHNVLGFFPPNQRRHACPDEASN